MYEVVVEFELSFNSTQTFNLFGNILFSKHLCDDVDLVNIITKRVVVVNNFQIVILKLGREEESLLRFDLSAICNTHQATLKKFVFYVTQKPGML